MKLSMKKLEILKKNIKFRGGLLGLKAFLKLLLLRFVLLLLSTTAGTKLMLLVQSYNCSKIKTSEGFTVEGEMDKRQRKDKD
ncbi:hypothetical protein Tco_0270545 [Tanacetum coccineum]